MIRKFSIVFPYEINKKLFALLRCSFPSLPAILQKRRTPSTFSSVPFLVTVYCLLFERTTQQNWNLLVFIGDANLLCLCIFDSAPFLHIPSKKGTKTMFIVIIFIWKGGNNEGGSTRLLLTLSKLEFSILSLCIVPCADAGSGNDALLSSGWYMEFMYINMSPSSDSESLRVLLGTRKQKPKQVHRIKDTTVISWLAFVCWKITICYYTPGISLNYYVIQFYRH